MTGHWAALLIAAALAYLIPLVSSALVRAHWPGEIAGLLTAALAAADGFVAEWVDAGDGWDWRRAAASALTAYLVASLARAQTWRGSRIDAHLLALGSHPKPGA